MSTHAEHRRMKPVFALARKPDIGDNPVPEAIFEAGSAGFQIWCTPDDHPHDPKGWNRILDKLIYGAFTKPCGFVASVAWKWDAGARRIVGVTLSTSAYERRHLLPDSFTDSVSPSLERESINNRPVDTAWAKSKVEWLFEQAGMSCPAIVVTAA